MLCVMLLQDVKQTIILPSIIPSLRVSAFTNNIQNSNRERQGERERKGDSDRDREGKKERDKKKERKRDRQIDSGIVR